MKNVNLIGKSAIVPYNRNHSTKGLIIAVNGNRIRVQFSDGTKRWYNPLYTFFTIY